MTKWVVNSFYNTHPNHYEYFPIVEGKHFLNIRLINYILNIIIFKGFLAKILLPYFNWWRISCPISKIKKISFRNLYCVLFTLLVKKQSLSMTTSLHLISFPLHGSFYVLINVKIERIFSHKYYTGKVSLLYGF